MSGGYAKFLLRKEKRTADELIKLCGFTSRSVFYSAFTKEVGVVIHGIREYAPVSF